MDRFPNNLSYNVIIIDILNDTGEFLKRTVLNEKLGSNMSQMTYNSVISAIPKEWKLKK